MIVAAVLLLYVLLILFFSFFLGRQENIRLAGKLTPSLIVPFRNEAVRIGKLLDSINQLDVEGLQVIFVDDHSEDDSVSIIESFPFNSSFKVELVSLTEKCTGKKMALIKGHEIATGDVIFHTDADAVLPANWIKDHLALHSAGADLVIGPHLSFGQDFFSSIQLCEQIVLSGVMMATNNLGFPFLASGANLSVLKASLPVSLEKALRLDRSSGDDVFLLQNFKENRKQVRFSGDSIVYTMAEKDWKGWILQRLRWAGKTGHLRSFAPFFTGIIVFFGNLFFWLGLAYCAIYPFYSPFLPISLFVKAFIDILFLFLTASVLRVKPPFWWIIPSSLIFSVSVILMPLLGLFFRSEWKGRRVDQFE